MLVDEAFRLWSVTIASLPSVPPQLRELLPNAAALLRRGRDHAALLPLLEVGGGLERRLRLRGRGGNGSGGGRPSVIELDVGVVRPRASPPDGRVNAAVVLVCG